MMDTMSAIGTKRTLDLCPTRYPICHFRELVRKLQSTSCSPLSFVDTPFVLSPALVQGEAVHVETQTSNLSDHVLINMSYNGQR